MAGGIPTIATTQWLAGDEARHIELRAQLARLDDRRRDHVQVVMLAFNEAGIDLRGTDINGMLLHADKLIAALAPFNIRGA